MYIEKIYQLLYHSVANFVVICCMYIMVIE